MPARARRQFFAATAAGIAAFAVFGVFNSLAPSFLVGSLHNGSHAVAGIVAFAAFASGAAAQSLQMRAPSRTLLLRSVPTVIIGLGWLTAGMWTASLTMFLVGGVLTGADWRWSFGVQALFGLLAGTAAFFRLPESRSEATRLRARTENPFASYLALLRQPVLTGYLLTGGLAGAALFSYVTSAPRMVIGELHIPPAHFGWVFGVNAVGLIGASQVNARLARRIPGDTLVQAALLTALAAALLLAACAWMGWGGLWGILAPLFVVISGLGFSQPNTSAAAMSVDRHRAGATAALLGTAFFGVGSLSGVATSLVPGRASEAMAAVIVATLVLALASYYALVAPRLRLGKPT